MQTHLCCMFATCETAAAGAKGTGCHDCSLNNEQLEYAHVCFGKLGKGFDQVNRSVACCSWLQHESGATATHCCS